MTSKQFVYSFIVVLGISMLGSLYFFMKQATQTTSVDPDFYTADWSKELQDSNQLFNGQMQFEIRCESCHGPKGIGGPIAPALNDNQWLHGSSLDEIFYIVGEGFPGTEMKGWRGKLQKNDLIAITLYVKSLSSTASQAK